MEFYLNRNQPEKTILWFDRSVFQQTKEMYLLAASAYDALGQTSKAEQRREAIVTLEENQAKLTNIDHT